MNIAGIKLIATLVVSGLLPTGAPAPETAVKMRSALDGKLISIADVAGKAGTLVIFTCNHCPFARGWERRIAELGNTYAKRGIGVILINANDPEKVPDDGFAGMQARAKSLGLQVPYVVDETSNVARAFGASVTPEAFLFDGSGKLRPWWTAEDRASFSARTGMLVAEYSAFSPVPGYTVNGALTLGENIADNSGLEIAYQAYHRSLGGRPAPVIDGMSGDERFFYGFAQIYRSKSRDEATLTQIKSDPHSPGEFRVNGTVRNHPAFYSTFGVQPGDRMYLPPGERVSIW